MKFALFLALPVVLAVPARLDARETKEELTDRYLFSTQLPTFLQYREQKNPNTVDWSSDGCTKSPDNPFGFPFEPACTRHDFGYRNYKAQSRFDSAGRARIDSNFKTDLKSQCASVSAKGSCNALANVYYAGVRLFGGFAKRDEGNSTASEPETQESAEVLIELYYNAMQDYRKAVKEDQANGLLPQK
ncbi:hypothetical protein NLG97_g2928 [Lecanicillium saksenae]|uniref:Uncharacterized protein n=1 Tax=Lecanicillium saksenae TaxID=468837 RepID=A0ACC1R274_9HYPO|nr:hypothetical protein NLG97_g2928 [Lecanicillium saksenae]